MMISLALIESVDVPTTPSKARPSGMYHLRMSMTLIMIMTN